MIRPQNAGFRVFLWAAPVDMRKSIDGLSILVESELQANPFDKALYVFCNRGRDKIKILCWEKNGFVVWYKRLEKQRFKWPRASKESAQDITVEELNWLLDGFDLWNNQPHKALSFESVA